MLKKTMITAAAALVMATGITAFQAKPADAGVTIQLVHGSGWGWGHKRHKGHFRGHRGPRFGYFDRNYRCFTRYKKVKVRRWNPRRHRWVVRRISRPVTICR